MKRDMELVREILLAVEQADAQMEFLRIDGYRDNVVWHHVWLLQDAGFLMAQKIGGTIEMLPQATPTCLTWEGCEFLDTARNPTVWKGVREKVGAAMGSVSVRVLAQLLSEAAKHQLGMK